MPRKPRKVKIDHRKRPLRGAARQLYLLAGQIRLMRDEQRGLREYCRREVDKQFAENLGDVRHELNELFRRLVSLDNALTHDWRGKNDAPENSSPGTGA